MTGIGLITFNYLSEKMLNISNANLNFIHIFNGIAIKLKKTIRI